MNDHSTTETKCPRCENTGVSIKYPTRDCSQLGRKVPNFCHCDIGVKKEGIFYNSEEVQKEIYLVSRRFRAQICLQESGVSPRFFRKKLDDLQDTPLIFEIIQDYVQNWTSYRKRGKGLYLEGPPGTGKTHAASALANALIETHVVPLYFINFAAVMDAIKKNFGKEGTFDYIKKLKTCEVLFIDDLGTENRTDWVEEQIFLIINHRYEFELPTIISSNCKLSELPYNTRIISRIFEMCKQVSFQNLPDRRLSL